jgi:hypothetical protein
MQFTELFCVLAFKIVLPSDIEVFPFLMNESTLMKIAEVQIDNKLKIPSDMESQRTCEEGKGRSADFTCHSNYLL